MAISIIGAGFARTGTLSLKLALERLGLGPCYHMREVLERHLDQVQEWRKAAEGTPVEWDAIFEGYRSAVDFPVAAFYRELADHYPAAKVVLTVRDPEPWFESFSNTVRHPLTEPLPGHLADWGAMVQKAIVERVFAGNLADRAHVIATFQRRNDEVRRTIPAERLLIYEVSHGWEPLCRFLDVPIPEEPFPSVNTTDEFRERRAPLFKV